MAVLLAILRPLAALNIALLRAGRALAIGLLGLMVLVIIAQVVFRYIVGDALNWTEEAARFGMLWMTGLVAASAYRWGGFVAIDMVAHALPRLPGQILTLALLIIALVVLVAALGLGHTHIFSGCLFKSSTLWLPFKLEFSLPIPLTGADLTLCTRQTGVAFAWEWSKMPLALSFLSLFVGMLLMLLVSVELVLREIAKLAGFGSALPNIIAATGTES
ncbi:MAG: TRAP transporter small permease subunit [Pseudomonadota bacterium]